MITQARLKELLHYDPDTGLFTTAEEAHAAYLKAKRELHEGCTI